MKFYVILLICIIFSNCSKSNYGDCDGYQVPSCIGNNNGTSYLDTLNNDWMSSDFDSIMYFINTVNGKTCSNIKSSYIKQINKYDTKLRQEKVRCGVSTCYDYCYLESEELTYNSLSNSPYRIIIYRGKSVNYFNIDTSTLQKASDKFVLGFGLNYYTLNLKDYTNTSSQNFHTKLNLGNNEYDSVYEYKMYLPPNAIALQGIYYTKKQGIVGYYLTDKVELWVRK